MVFLQIFVGPKNHLDFRGPDKAPRKSGKTMTQHSDFKIGKLYRATLSYEIVNFVENRTKNILVPIAEGSYLLYLGKNEFGFNLFLLPNGNRVYLANEISARLIEKK